MDIKMFLFGRDAPQNSFIAIYVPRRLLAIQTGFLGIKK